MESPHTLTAHCGSYCFRTVKGRDHHFHPGKAKYQRHRKKSCGCDSCILDRQRYRERNAPRWDDE